MTTIAFASRAEYVRDRERELLGTKPQQVKAQPITTPMEKPLAATGSVTIAPLATKVVPSEIEKAVRRMPVLYVIAFFGVVVLSAVLIIWNTLQVNKLTAERATLHNTIALNEQRLIRLRAEEMQLSAPDRIRAIAQTKLGMIPANGQDIVIIK